MFPLMQQAVMSDELQSNEPSISLLHFSLPRRATPSSLTSCMSDRCTWVNSILASFMNRFSFLSCSPAVGNRSSRSCFSSIKSMSSAYSISSGSPNGEIGGGGGGGGLVWWNFHIQMTRHILYIISKFMLTHNHIWLTLRTHVGIPLLQKNPDKTLTTANIFIKNQHSP